MPNIGTLPTAADLLVEQAKGGAYGQHLTWERLDDSLVLLTKDQRIAVAQGTRSSATVDLNTVDAQTCPYVNAFIAHTGQRVEKYWRTKTYRIVAGAHAPHAIPGHTPALAPVPRTKPVPVVVEHPEPMQPEPEPEVEPIVVEAQPATVVEVQTEPVDSSDIPMVEHPTKVKVKGAGKGWTRVGEIIVTDEGYQTLLDAWTLRGNGIPSSVLITGPAGTAKTALVRSFAASLGVPFLKVDGGSIRTADDWSGAFRQDPNTKTWSHRWSPFARCLQRGDPMVILVDEINRTESPQALNALLGLLDWTGQLLVPDANMALRLPAGVLVVATANIGPEFVGTLPIDGAVRQRFPYGVRMQYPTEAIETNLLVDLTSIDKDIAGRLVRMAETQRVNREDPQQYPSGSVISTRVILDIARRITTCNTPPRDAVWATLRGQFDPGDEKALSVVVDTQFPAPVSEDDSISEEDAAPAPTEIACPACGHSNPVGKTTCQYCGYGLPQAPGTIRLQNTPYGQP